MTPGEITSHAGWRPGPQSERLPSVIEELKAEGVRVSVFVDAEPEAIRLAASVGADRVELYTEPFARAFERGRVEADRAFARCVEAAQLAHEHHLGVNAGHDLDLENLTLFRALPWLDEVSIGHAIISRAIFVGLSAVVSEYLGVLSKI